MEATLIQDKSTTKTHAPTFNEFEYRFDGANVVLFMQGEEVSTSELLAIPSNPAALMETLADHAGLLTWVGVVAADAEADTRDAKESLEVIEAQVYSRIREDWETEGVKVTEDKLKSAVKQDDEVIEAVADYLYCLRKAKVLDAFNEGFRARGVLLASIAGIMRDEFRAYNIQSN